MATNCLCSSRTSSYRGYKLSPHNPENRAKQGREWLNTDYSQRGLMYKLGAVADPFLIAVSPVYSPAGDARALCKLWQNDRSSIPNRSMHGRRAIHFLNRIENINGRLHRA